MQNYRKRANQRRKAKVKLKFRRFVLLFVLLYIISFIFAELNIDKLKGNIIKDASSLLFETSVNEGVKDCLEYFHDDNCEINNVLSLQSALSAELKASLTEKINCGINKTVTVFIPSGNFTGLWLLEGVGLPIPVRVNFTGSCRLNFTESFESAGINQTLYTLKINVTAALHTNSITYGSDEINLNTEYILVQRLIVGDVPGILTDRK